MNMQTQTELAMLDKKELLQRCMALQNNLETNHRPIPGSPRYILTPDGYMMWQERSVLLSEDNKTLIGIPGIGYTISSLGWEEINSVLRVQIYNDAEVRRIHEDGILKAVEVKGVAVGCIGGVPQVTTLVLTFNFYEMFLRELTGLTEKHYECARLGTKETKPEGNNPWIYYKIEGDAGVWVDLSHKEVITKLKTLQQRRQWPDRLAFAFLRRNLIRKFAGSISQKVKGSKAEVIVKGWYYPIDKNRMERISQGALKGIEVDTEIPLKISNSETITDIDDDTIEGELVDETTGEVTGVAVGEDKAHDRADMAQVKARDNGQPVRKTTEKPKSEATKTALQKTFEGWSKLNTEQKRLLKKEYPQTMGEYNLRVLKSIQKRINELLDNQITEKEKAV